MAKPVTGTKNITMNGPVSRVGQAICRKVTSGVKLMRQTEMRPRPTMPSDTMRRASIFSTALPTRGAVSTAKIPMMPVA